MARWIHEFRSSGERALTVQEYEAIARRASRLSAKRYLLGTLSVLLFFVALVPLAIATAGPSWVWILAIPIAVLACYCLSWANAAEKLSLLHRRALRLGSVEEFHRVRGDETARRMWASVGLQEAKDEAEHEDEPLILPTNEYWRVDEKFEESLKHTAGGKVETFTAVGRDGAILFVEDRPVRTLMEPPVWEVVG